MAAATVTALDPASGPAGTLITLTGTGFTEDTSAVKFGAVSAGTRFSVVSGTKIRAYAPAGSGTVSVKVTTPGGTPTVGSNWTYDTYEGPPGGGGGSAPTVTSVVPSSAVDNDGGDAVTVNGTGFTTATAVLFGTALAQFTVTSDTALAVTTPAGSGVVDVAVVNAYGISANTANDNFTYPVGLIPTVTSFTPTSAGEQALITITGTNFWTAAGLVVVTGVTFTGAGATEIPAVFRAASATSLIAYVPEGAVTGVIKVYSEAGSATSTSFTCLGTVYGVIQTSANGKNRIFYDSGVPGATANLAGDVWFRYGTGGEANQVIAQYVGQGGTSWQLVTMNNAVIATLDVAKLTAGTISVAVELTSATITGGTIRTYDSGNRIEMTNSLRDRISLYSGVAGETASAFIQVSTAGADSAFVLFQGTNCGHGGPAMSLNTVDTANWVALNGNNASVNVGQNAGRVELWGGSSYIRIGSATTGSVYQYGNSCSLEIGDSSAHATLTGVLVVTSECGVARLWTNTITAAGGDTGTVTIPASVALTGTVVDVSGGLHVDGKIHPQTDFPGTPSGWSSADGVWIQDNNTTGNRLKITFNSTAYTLTVSNATYKYTLSTAFTRTAL